jgi:23S rRNA (adenine2503-C2)-methyltransferase
MDISKVSAILQRLGQPAFRIKQITKNYFSGRYGTFMDMTDLPMDLRQSLNNSFSLYTVAGHDILKDKFSQKALLSLADGLKIETVLMDYGDWQTACVSSQVGCPLGCKFCATGQMGFKRNLVVDEIVDQILFWNHQLYPKYTGRVVFMGMGEPFLNWDNLIASLKIINSKDGLNIGSRKISISTAGITPAIIGFADLDTEVNLAISLHSADQKTREFLMPIAKKYPLYDLTKALDYYAAKTKRQIFFEYALIKGVNDTPHHQKLLTDFINRNRLFFLNIIPLNPVKNGCLPSAGSTFDNFVKGLSKNHVEFSIRHSIGQNINSACGQLAV